MKREEIISTIQQYNDEHNYEKLFSYCFDLDFSYRVFITGILYKKYLISKNHQIIRAFDIYCTMNMEYFDRYNFFFIQSRMDFLKIVEDREPYLDGILCYAVAPYYGYFLKYYDFDWVYKELKNMESTRDSVEEYERLHLNSDKVKEIYDQILIPDIASRIEHLIKALDYKGLERFVYELPDEFYILNLFWMYKHFILEPSHPLAELLSKFSALYPEKEYQYEFNLFRIQLHIEILEFNPSDNRSMETLLQIFLEDQERYKEFVPFEELLEILKLGNPNSKILESFKY